MNLRKRHQMTRFIYLTDTHLGACNDSGYHTQPRRVNLAEALVEALGRWIDRHDVDFVLHGGDIVDAATAELIHRSTVLFSRLTVPTYLCLGNHDLMEPGAIEQWRTLHDGMLPGGKETFSLRFNEFALYVLAHHYGSTDPPHFWDAEGGTDTQRPVLDATQRSEFESYVARIDRPVIVAVHAMMNAVPAEQCGAEEDQHAPDRQFHEFFADTARRHGGIRLFLAGHNHVNTIVDQELFVSTTTASFTEGRFDARVITVRDGTIDVQTVSFADNLDEPIEVGREFAGVYGGPAQRSCVIRC